MAIKRCLMLGNIPAEAIPEACQELLEKLAAAISHHDGSSVITTADVILQYRSTPDGKATNLRIVRKLLKIRNGLANGCDIEIEWTRTGPRELSCG